MMMTTPAHFDAGELCSRKLLELVADRQAESQQLADDALRAAIEELVERRHYLRELASLGISPRS